MDADIPASVSAKDPPLNVKEQLDHALKNFHFLADQRLKAFHFYILLLTASVAGTFSAHQADKLSFMWQLAIGALHLIIPLIFMLLEQRNVVLVDTAASSLCEIEKHSGLPKYLQVFTADRQNKRRLAWLISFRMAINLAHISQILFGVILLSLVISERPPVPSSVSHEKGERSGEFKRINRPESAKIRTKKTKKTTKATTRELLSGDTE
jgi:hypothetical protein